MVGSRIITTLEELESSQAPCLVLYSGGVDSSFFLLWARKRGIPTIALYVNLDVSTPDPKIRSIAETLGACFVEVNYLEPFVSKFIEPAIRSCSEYWNQYPVSASLSRPAIAEAAVTVAHDRNVKRIVHCSTKGQNSATRFNRSLTALTDATICNPFQETAISRDRKIDALNKAVNHPFSPISYDQNIWATSYEGGSYDKIDRPTDSTQYLNPIGITSRNLKLEFQNGVPVGLNDQKVPLCNLLEELRGVGIEFGLGIYDGFEENESGVSLREVRAAPAAEILFRARKYLNALIFTEREWRIRSLLSNEWTSAISAGFWHSDLSGALIDFFVSHDRSINGCITMGIAANCCRPLYVDEKLAQLYNARVKTRI